MLRYACENKEKELKSTILKGELLINSLKSQINISSVTLSPRLSATDNKKMQGHFFCHAERSRSVSRSKLYPNIQV